MKQYSLLCLGDSYTIGEGVPLYESFPYQLVQLLRKAQVYFHAPEIVAKTGWTTFELADYLLHHQLSDQYDFVTLLIGVNNQYRGLVTNDFEADFEFLLRKALQYTKKSADNVVVISIPDWGITPFAANRNSKQIREEIDEYNNVCCSVAQKYQTHFVNITDEYRIVGMKEEFLVTDQLHPSGKEYGKWAAKIFEIINIKIKKI